MVPIVSESDPSPRFVRFGVFEADLRTGELRRSGRKVPLQEKPFQVLALLLERAPDLVTLEEFERKLWPDVNVAFPDTSGLQSEGCVKPLVTTLTFLGTSKTSAIAATGSSTPLRRSVRRRKNPYRRP